MPVYKWNAFETTTIAGKWYYLLCIIFGFDTPLMQLASPLTTIEGIFCSVSNFFSEKSNLDKSYCPVYERVYKKPSVKRDLGSNPKS